MKQSKLLNTRNNKNKRYNNTRFKGGDAQMFILMGIVLAVSVIIVAVINSNISGVGVTVTRSRSQSILNEFDNIQEKFGIALVYSVDRSQNIEDEFDRVAQAFYCLEIPNGMYFNAECEQYYTLSKEYVIKSTITLSDGESSISKERYYFVDYEAPT